MAQFSNSITVEFFEQLYEWAAYYGIDFLEECMANYLQRINFPIRPESSAGKRTSLRKFYKYVQQQNIKFQEILLSFDKIVSLS
jgi:hypothetical protein